MYNIILENNRRNHLDQIIFKNYYIMQGSGCWGWVSVRPAAFAFTSSRWENQLFAESTRAMACESLKSRQRGLKERAFFGLVRPLLAAFGVKFRQTDRKGRSWSIMDSCWQHRRLFFSRLPSFSNLFTILTWVFCVLVYVSRQYVCMDEHIPDNRSKIRKNVGIPFEIDRFL